MSQRRKGRKKSTGRMAAASAAVLILAAAALYGGYRIIWGRSRNRADGIIVPMAKNMRYRSLIPI